MAEEEFPREDELESRQAAALYPVGRVLRTTFDAENHDSLGNDLTGLMLELAHIDPDAEPIARAVVPPVAPVAAEPLPAPTPTPTPTLTPTPPPAAAVQVLPAPASWWRAMLDKLLSR